MSEKNKIIAGVVGDPISHSLSPRLHGYWLEQYDINGEYQAFHVKIESLPEFISTMKENGISGVNLTVPHKEEVMSLLDFVDEKAKTIGAVNTVFFNEEGKLCGTNTDGYGFITHLKQTAGNWKAIDGSVLILGAGGAARAVISSLLDEGVSQIKICNRTISRAETLVSEINDKRLKVVPWEDRADALMNISLLVNVTTLGMKGQYPLEISLENLPKSAIVYDIVYNPLETHLLKEAALRGNQIVDGLGMLLHQAAPGFKLWFKKMPEVNEELQKHMLEAFK